MEFAERIVAEPGRDGQRLTTEGPDYPCQRYTRHVPGLDSCGLKAFPTRHVVGRLIRRKQPGGRTIRPEESKRVGIPEMEKWKDSQPHQDECYIEFVPMHSQFHVPSYQQSSASSRRRHLKLPLPRLGRVINSSGIAGTAGAACDGPACLEDRDDTIIKPGVPPGWFDGFGRHRRKG